MKYAINSIAVQSDGKVVFSGFSADIHYPGNVATVYPALIRTTSDLVIDTSYKGNISGTGIDVGPGAHYRIAMHTNDKSRFYGRDGS